MVYSVVVLLRWGAIVCYHVPFYSAMVMWFYGYYYSYRVSFYSAVVMGSYVYYRLSYNRIVLLWFIVLSCY